MKIIDISQEVLGCRVFKGDPTPKSEKAFSIESGDLYNLSTISMCVHNGTHVDAPAHFISGGKTVSDFGLDRFVGDCYVEFDKWNNVCFPIKLEPGINSLKIYKKAGGKGYFRIDYIEL